MKRIFLFISILFLCISVFSQSGTKITSSIVPNSFLDNYSTHNSKYGRGGYRSVKTITERDAIYTSRRDTGMLVYVSADEKIYILKNGITNASWVELKLGNNTSTDTVAYTKNSIPITTSGYTYAFRNTGTNTNYSVFVSTYENTQGPVDSRYTKANNSITVYPAVNCNLDVLIVLNSFSQGEGSGGSSSGFPYTKTFDPDSSVAWTVNPTGSNSAEFYITDPIYSGQIYYRYSPINGSSISMSTSLGGTKGSWIGSYPNMISFVAQDINHTTVVRIDSLGMRYGEHKTNSNPNWIPDKNYVDSIVGSAPVTVSELKTFYTPVSTSGVLETDLFSYTVPANQLNMDGSSLDFNVLFFNTGVTAGSSYIRLYFAGTATPNPIKQGSFSTGVFGSNETRIKLIRTSSTSATLYAISTPHDITNAVVLVDITGLDFTATNILKVTGQCATNSFFAKLGSITFHAGM